MTPAELAARIDQTLLAPTATPAQVEALCAGALRHRFRAVCVSPAYVALAVEHLEGSPVRVCTVAGFPLGTVTLASKAREAEEAVRAGASDVDMVINIGRLKAGQLDYVRDEIRAVVRGAARAAVGAAHRAPVGAAHRAPGDATSPPPGDAGHRAFGTGGATAEGIVVKVIIEACYLTDEEKVVACRLAEEAGARFVKTSTGFGPGGATVEDVHLMRRAVGDRLGVKASGGIRTLAQALALLGAGADVLGTSSGEAIMAELVSHT
ncbi:MAG: deoxyribose-phosphate aldolase [Bacillota bacterium]|nr:deoxyribose-phosphate aldolase [Bacillota bacterium]